MSTGMLLFFSNRKDDWNHMEKTTGYVIMGIRSNVTIRYDIDQFYCLKMVGRPTKSSGWLKWLLAIAISLAGVSYVQTNHGKQNFLCHMFSKTFYLWKVSCHYTGNSFGFFGSYSAWAHFFVRQAPFPELIWVPVAWASAKKRVGTGWPTVMGLFRFTALSSQIREDDVSFDMVAAVDKNVPN